MAKFFRRTRQKLLKEGNLKKYLAYAIGEVLLVMFGILLALQVHNWNENKKANEKAHSYLQQILNELKRENLIYDTKKKLQEIQVKKFEECIDLLYLEQTNFEEAKAFFKKFYSFNTDHLVPIDATYQEIVSSSDLGIFKNDTLINQIVQYYSMNYDVAIQIKEFNDVSTRQLSNRAVKNNLNTLKFLLDYHRYPEMYDDEDWTFLNNPKSTKFKALEGIAVLFILRDREHARMISELSYYNEELQLQVESEIDRY